MENDTTSESDSNTNRFLNFSKRLENCFCPKAALEDHAINSISFHQPHKQITKLKLYDLVTVLLFGEFVTTIRKNHSIFIFKANYKPQFKNCKFFISNVCNLWLHNNFTNSLLYLRIIWNKLSEYLLTEYYELDTILNATIMNLINSVCNPVVDF